MFGTNITVEISFQLTRSRGAWPRVNWVRKFIQYFNSHAHVERDGIPQQYLQISTNFNSHAHVERDSKFYNDVVW